MSTGKDNFEYKPYNSIFAKEMVKTEDFEECSEFFDGFLNPLKSKLKAEIFDVLHGGFSSESPIWETIQLKVEDDRGIESLLSNVIAGYFSTGLNKTGKQRESLEFLDRRLKRIGKEDYSTLMSIAKIHQLSADHSTSFEIYQRAQLLCSDETKEENKLKLALVLMKYAVDAWNLSLHSNARNYQSSSISLLEEINNNRKIPTILNSEDFLLMLDAYKTAGYLYRVQEDEHRSLLYFQKTLTLIELDSKALSKKLKIYTHIAASYARLKAFDNSKEYLQKSLDLIDIIVSDGNFMSFHFTQVIHILSRISYTFECLRNNEQALRSRMQSMKIAEEFLTSDHPEKARIAIDIALLNYYMRNHRESEIYMEMSENILEDNRYENDIVKMKLYIKEITDALCKLGRLFSKHCNYASAEINLLKCLDITMKVYGENHKRMAKIHKDLAFLYSKWQRISLAEEHFLKGIGILKELLPGTNKQLQTMEDAMERMKNPLPQRYDRGNRTPRGTGRVGPRYN